MKRRHVARARRSSASYTFIVTTSESPSGHTRAELAADEWYRRRGGGAAPADNNNATAAAAAAAAAAAEAAALPLVTLLKIDVEGHDPQVLARWRQ